ncbi:MAG: DUF5050 domain-containing protein [Lachnospiraceae bacterium]|nr:DUF5050 domain-containing protein [Lachnospiraceae bacterium]
MKKQTKALGLFLMLCCFGIFFGKAIKAEASETVTKGSYTYFAEDGTIYKMNSSSGKVSKVKKISQSNTVEIFAVKGSWIYITVDDYYSVKGTDQSWVYVYRIKTNGKSLQNLGKGSCPYIYGNYIYFNRRSFDRNATTYDDMKSLGIYRMKLDGSSKKKLASSAYCQWIKIYNKKIYYSVTGSDPGVYQMDLNGKNGKKIMSDYTSDTAYFAGNKMYVSYTPSSTSYVYSYDLTTGSRTYLATGTLMAAYNGELYYHGTYSASNTTLYRYKISTGAKSTVCKRTLFRNVIAGKKWLIINYYRGNYRKNIGVDRITKNGKSRKVITTYFRS